MLENQTYSKILCIPLNLLVLAFMSFLSLSSIAQETENGTEIDITPPENWYQVEMILFTQEGNTQGELPPEQLELSFPKNLKELVDAEELATKIANAIEGAMLPQPDSDEANEIEQIPQAVVEDPIFGINSVQPISGPDAINQNTHSVDDALSSSPPEVSEEYFVAEYENTLTTLAKEFRDLNDSARLLRRRNYNVIFHEAWRFIAQENEKQPWLLFNADGNPHSHGEVEGSVRFYKSRFLHFQADIWRVKFSDDPEFDGLKIDLPQQPLIDPPEGTPDAWRLVPAQRDQSNEDISTSMTPIPQLSESENLLPLVNHSDAGDTDDRNEAESTPSANEVVDISASEYQLESYDPRIEEREVSNKNRITPPIQELWPIKMAKRLEEGRVYYLDHPEVGVMVTIKRYQPQPINLPTIDQSKVSVDTTTD